MKSHDRKWLDIRGAEQAKLFAPPVSTDPAHQKCIKRFPDNDRMVIISCLECAVARAPLPSLEDAALIRALLWGATPDVGSPRRPVTAPRTTVVEARALPVTVDLPTPGHAFGRTRSHDLARAGESPCPVLPLGNKLMVLRSAILAALGIDETAVPAGQAADASRPTPAAMTEALEAVPDLVTRHLAAALIARLTELGSGLDAAADGGRT